MKVQRNGQSITIWASTQDTHRWATRPWSSWPCSKLSGKRLRAELQRGDLVDLTVNGRGADIPADELTAFLDDCRTEILGYYICMGGKCS